METVNNLDLAANWSDSERHQLFVNREKLLLTFDQEPGVLSLTLIQSDPAKVLAALSLTQEGYLKLDSNNPNLLRLSESGEKIAAGARALSHG